MAGPFNADDHNRPDGTSSIFGYQFLSGPGNDGAITWVPEPRPPISSSVNPQQLSHNSHQQPAFTPVITPEIIHRLDDFLSSLDNPNLTRFLYSRQVPRTAAETGSAFGPNLFSHQFPTNAFMIPQPVQASSSPPHLSHYHNSPPQQLQPYHGALPTTLTFTPQELAVATSLANGTALTLPPVYDQQTAAQPGLRASYRSSNRPLNTLSVNPGRIQARYQTMQGFQQPQPQQHELAAHPTLPDGASSDQHRPERRQTLPNATTALIGTATSPTSTPPSNMSLAASAGEEPPADRRHSQASSLESHPRVSATKVNSEPEEEARPRKRPKTVPNRATNAGAAAASASPPIKDEPIAHDYDASRKKRHAATERGKNGKTPAQGCGNKRVHLTEQQRRVNHNNSEKKRRRLLDKGYHGLNVLLSAHAHGSKCIQLNAAADYLQALVAENETLALQARELTNAPEDS